MQVRTSGLIIAERNISEKDKLLTIFTKDYGVVRAFAKGAKNITNKNFSGLSLLSYSDLTLYKGRDKYIINNAYLKKSFFNLRKDIEILALSQYFCEVILNLVGETPNCENILRLTLNCLYYLMEGKKENILIKSIFEMRILSMSGYMPDLTRCSKCGKFDNKAKMYFIISKGQLVCSECLSNEGCDAVYLNANVLFALRYIVYADFNKMFSFSLSENHQNKLALVTDKYLLRCIDRTLKTLDFYNQVRSFDM